MSIMKKRIREIVKQLLPYGYVVKKQKKKLPYIQDSEHPTVFAKDGNKIQWMYLSDELVSHTPHHLAASKNSSYIIYDRYDYKLPCHMYTYDRIFDIQGAPKRKFAFFCECSEIKPDFYKKLAENPQLLNDFDGIFTNQDAILKQHKNAYYVVKFAPWYGTSIGGGRLSRDRFLSKNKMISIVSSAKETCNLHRFRRNLAQRYSEEKEKRVDCFGSFDGGKWVRCCEYLEDYRYHIVVENQISNGYITEKITNCFAAQVVPIYIGAPDIGKYFDINGIIYVPENDIDNIDKYLQICSEEDYLSRKEAIIRNYDIAVNIEGIDDYLYHHYYDLIFEGID